MRSACPWPWKISNNRLAQGGAVFGGGKGGAGGTTYQTQQTTIPPEVRARYDAVNARAEQVAQQPFQPYTGQFVAPLTNTQQAGIGQIAAAGQGYQPYQQAATAALTGSAEAALPYYGAAGQNIEMGQAAGAPYTGAATLAGLAGTQAVDPGQLNIGQYMNPYLQSVVAPTMQGLRQQQAAEQSQLMGSQAMRGAFGGDRGGIAAANLARQQGLASTQAEAELLSQGYQQALQAAQQQQGVGLGAAQANRAAFQQLAPQLLQIGQQAFQQPMAAAQAQQGLGQGLLGYGQGMAQGLTGIGQQGTQTGLAAGQALLGAGTMEQQTQQQLNAALYNQYQQQMGYPFQVAQFLANIALGTGPLYGSTTTGVTGQPTPFFSDERLKTDIVEIGRTHDGQRIIKFRYKNEPPGTSHIGLSAQDVEKHHPEAVSETPEGIKAVDYDMATKPAERAYGGGLMPSSEGGAVHPSMAGLGFAMGGTPVPGSNPEADAMKRGLAPRAAFAGGGEAEMMRKMFPWSAASTPGAGGAWTPGLTVKPQAPLGSGVQLQRPAARPTGLSQTVDAVKGGLGAVDDAKKLAKSGKEAYDWAKDAFGDLRDKMAMPGLEEEAAGNIAAGVAGRWHGGRAGYATDGAVEGDDNPVIPYDDGGNSPLDKLTSQQVTPAKLPEHKLDMRSAAGGDQKKDGTGKTIGSLAGMGIGAMFGMPGVGAGLGGLLGGAVAKNGGRIGYATDGGVDDRYIRMVERGESGGRNVRNPASGAGGHFQFMPATWAAARKALPHLPPDVMSATRDEQVEAMNWLTNQNRSSLRSSLGRDPSDAELRYAHYHGPAGATALMKLNPETRFADLPDNFWRNLGEKYSNTTMLAQNPNLRDETVGGLLNKYQNEFKRGASAPPPAETHLREEPPVRSAGLAPPISDVEENPVRRVKPFIEEKESDPRFDRFVKFDRYNHGGLVPRKGYQTAGAVEDAFGLDPDVQTQLAEEVNSLTPPATLAQARSAARGDDIPWGPTPSTPAQARGAGLAPSSAAPAATNTGTGIAPPLPPPTPIGPPPNIAEAQPAAQAPDAHRSFAPTDVAAATTPSGAPTPGFFDKNGWFERNRDWVLPAVSGIGKMLSSPSPYLGVAIGQGLGEAAQMYPSMVFKQQGLDIQQQQANTGNVQTLLGELDKLQRSKFNIESRPGGKAPEWMQKAIDNLQEQVLRATSNYKPISDTSFVPGNAEKVSPPPAGPVTGAPPTQATTYPPVPPAVAPTAPPNVPGAVPPGTPMLGGQPVTLNPQGIPLVQGPNGQMQVPTLMPTLPSFARNLPDAENPDVLDAQAATLRQSQNADDQSRAMEAENKATNIRRNWMATGQYVDRNGQTQTIPEWNRIRQARANQENNQQWYNQQGEIRASQEQLNQTFGSIAKQFEQLKPGKFADIKADMSSILESAFPGQTFTPTSNSVAYQTIIKDATRSQFDALRAGASPKTNDALNRVQEMIADPTKEPGTNHNILKLSLGTLQNEMKLAQAKQAAFQQDPTVDMNAFENKWRATNTLAEDVADVGKNIAVRGMYPRDNNGQVNWTAAVPGQVYILEPGLPGANAPAVSAPGRYRFDGRGYKREK